MFWLSGFPQTNTVLMDTELDKPQNVSTLPAGIFRVMSSARNLLSDGYRIQQEDLTHMSHHHRDHSADTHPSLLIGVRTKHLNGAQPKSTADIRRTRDFRRITWSDFRRITWSKEHFVKSLKCYLRPCVDRVPAQEFLDSPFDLNWMDGLMKRHEGFSSLQKNVHRQNDMLFSLTFTSSAPNCKHDTVS